MAPPPISNAIRRLRFEHGEMTQQALAEILGIRFQFISAVERGDSHYSLEQTRRLIKKFRLDVRDVVSVVMTSQESEVRAAFKLKVKEKKKKILRA